MIYLAELRGYLKVLVPQVWKAIGAVLLFVGFIIIIKFLISKIPEIRGNHINTNWGLKEDEIKYIYNGQKQEDK